ncbi:major facilitator superfamily domain-containing protein [Xylariomycetidae sp. FL2044]|nr:major facilitator superfamily domain-containing protein [Xylariomycetidae sp. FL2044]
MSGSIEEKQIEPQKTAIESHLPDAEAPSNIHDAAQVRRLEVLKKQHGATWDSPLDPNDPYNWAGSRKMTIATIISLGQLVTLMSASMTAAALDDISSDLGIGTAAAQISFSIYFLGLAFGPFPIAAVAEMNGRKNIWVASNLWYVLWNALCPVGHSKGLMIAGRFLAATGASAGITLTGPIMADLYEAKDRGKSLALASFLPYLGPALGPIVGGVVAQLVDWPWLFWVMSIFNAFVTLIGAIFLRESYTPLLLRRKAQAQSGRPADPSATVWKWALWHDVLSRLGTNLMRPLRILIRRPVMQVISLTTGLNFGIYTLTLSTFATLWIDAYGDSKLTSSLHYISIAIGGTLSAQVGGRAMDWLYHRLRRHHTGGDPDAGAPLAPGKPEYRAPYMVFGTVLQSAGLLWYGWSAQHRRHWAVVDVGAAVFTCGGFVLSQALLAYTLDEFAEYGASANAAMRVLSQIFGFVFPIFAPRLYEVLGYGWGNSLLALIFIVMAFPVPICLWYWGDRLRALGRPAMHEQ